MQYTDLAFFVVLVLVVFLAGGGFRRTHAETRATKRARREAEEWALQEARAQQWVREAKRAKGEAPGD